MLRGRGERELKDRVLLKVSFNSFILLVVRSKSLMCGCGLGADSWWKDGGSAAHVMEKKAIGKE